VRVWKPEVPAIHEVFEAGSSTAPTWRTHDAWTVFTVDEGSIALEGPTAAPTIDAH
jgi:hypothetical protein